jgi:hypothetical protein
MGRYLESLTLALGGLSDKLRYPELIEQSLQEFASDILKLTDNRVTLEFITKTGFQTFIGYTALTAKVPGHEMTLAFYKMDPDFGFPMNVCIGEGYPDIVLNNLEELDAWLLDLAGLRITAKSLQFLLQKSKETHPDSPWRPFGILAPGVNNLITDARVWQTQLEMYHEKYGWENLYAWQLCTGISDGISAFSFDGKGEMLGGYFNRHGMSLTPNPVTVPGHLWPAFRLGSHGINLVIQNYWDWVAAVRQLFERFGDRIYDWKRYTHPDDDLPTFGQGGSGHMLRHWLNHHNLPQIPTARE